MANVGVVVSSPLIASPIDVEGEHREQSGADEMAACQQCAATVEQAHRMKAEELQVMQHVGV